MIPGAPLRIPIRFDTWYGVLSRLLLILPSRSYVEIDRDQIEVRMDWAFRSRFPRSAVASVSESALRPWNRGIHGFAGRWLVNGSGRGLVIFDLVPSQRGSVMGFTVRLKRLAVSVTDPAALAEAVEPATRS